MLLTEEGHEVHSVYSGRRVMGAVIDFDPDVVLLDIAMPEMDGWETLASIRELFRAWEHGYGLEQILGGIDGLAFVRLTSGDVVRHRIVQDIVNAYERADATTANGPS